MSVDIIIPYFQRSPGVLIKAVQSVLAQTYTDWRLIIVDDGSPHAADLELASLSSAERARIEIIKQPNGGVSAARNRGLGAVRAEVKFVAFLDSDDEWTADHLKHAIDALSDDADMFWGHVGSDGTFDTDSLPSAIVPADQRRPTSLVGVFKSERVASLLVGEWWRHMHISTIVLRADLAKKVRFNEQLRSAEDFDFFRQIAAQQPIAVFSDQTSVNRGVGDNIWHDVDFADVRIAQERLNTFRQLSLLRRLPGLRKQEHDLLRLRREVAREQFVWNQFLRRKRGNTLDYGLILKWLSFDPLLLRTLVRLKLRPETMTQLPTSQRVEQTVPE